MIRKSALAALTFAPVLVAAEPSMSAPAARPNIVFILADDLRWNTLGCAGDPVIRTPAIDRLARRGVSFGNTFATTAICSASRASIFTGQYQRRHGLDTFNKGFTPAQWVFTYPALLRSAGYYTGFIGKFGVGGRPAIQARAADFDYWRGLTGQGGPRFIDPNDPTQTHTTARMGDQSLEFLRRRAPDKPFCLSLSFNSPHARDGQPREFEPDRRDEDLYATTTLARPPTANEEYFGKLQPFVQRSEARKRWEKRFATDDMSQRTMRDYYRLVSGIDREVARIVAELEKQGVAENTVIFFTSDNGWFAGDRGLADKWFMYEESIRLPLIIIDPRNPASRRGAQVDAMALNIDFGPTILDFAGVRIPAVMQGRSLRPLVTGEPVKDWRTDFFYEHTYAPEIIPPSEGVRNERWSYIHWLAPNPEIEELYDLNADPLESHNLAADSKYSKILMELQARRRAFLDTLR